MSISPHSPFSPIELREKIIVEHLPKSYSEQFFWALKSEEMGKESLSLENRVKAVEGEKNKILVVVLNEDKSYTP